VFTLEFGMSHLGAGSLQLLQYFIMAGDYSMNDPNMTEISFLCGLYYQRYAKARWYDAGRVQMQQCACARESHAVLNKQTRHRRVPATKNQKSKQKALFRTPYLGGLEHLMPRSKS
jgi:hypothetical protein